VRLERRGSGVEIGAGKGGSGAGVGDTGSGAGAEDTGSEPGGRLWGGRWVFYVWGHPKQAFKAVVAVVVHLLGARLPIW
jgi:hypothetical protein